MGEFIDVIKVLVSPIEKLIDVVGNGIGKLYEPCHKRKMADATAYEIETIAKSMDATDMLIVYDQNGVRVDMGDFTRLMERTATRMMAQEAIKQNNIERVIDNAYEMLATQDECSADPVEQGWINRFFDSVADVSDEDLQNIWGKVLAGEIVHPKSYSLRTLETLKNLSKHEAELFQKIAPYILSLNGNLFLPSNKELLRKSGITYKDVLTLDECGLINSGGLVSITQLVTDKEPVGVHNSSKVIVLNSLGKSEVNISIGIYGLTKAGSELLQIVDCQYNSAHDEYIYDFAQEIVKHNPNKIKAAVYKIELIDINGISYESTALREFPAKK